ncbi:hypothetical protein HYU72_01640 [Candidatus Berkelbacteria bacterium]|nr:hypothetical protein [Candidatus Berkelbacteria bacterium]MBI2588102.1 hypothetical protein [Candidatus Berkelbacteria bacterium]
MQYKGRIARQAQSSKGPLIVAICLVVVVVVVSGVIFALKGGKEPTISTQPPLVQPYVSPVETSPSTPSPFPATDSSSPPIPAVAPSAPPSLQPTTITPSPFPETVQKTGTIKGTLVYFFNRNYGDKPDSGSAIWLIKGEVEEVPENYVFVGGISGIYYTTVSPGEKSFKIDVFKHTIADGNGNYEFRDVPEGTYTLVLESSHTNDSNQRDVYRKHMWLSKTVRAGETADGSWDFGMTHH